MASFTHDILTKTKESAITTTTSPSNIAAGVTAVNSNTSSSYVLGVDTSDASLITLSICSVVTIAAVGLILWLDPLQDPANGSNNNHILKRSTSAAAPSSCSTTTTTSSNDKYNYGNKDSRWYRLPRLVSTLSVIKEEDDNKNNEEYSDDFEDTSTMSSELL